MERVIIWLKAIRAPFFTADLVPTVVGTSLAFLHRGSIDIWNALLCLLGLILLNTSVNLLNDYGDHLSGNDVFNKNFSQFSGGSRFIQEGKISARSYLIVGIITLVMGSSIGLYLNYISRGNVILILGLIGAFSVLFYTIAPVRIGYRGVGEMTVGINLGILATAGSYYIQTHTLNLSVFLAGIPVALLISAILYINEFPDYEADRKAGKKTLVVLLGLKRARVGLYILIIGTFLSIIIPVIYGEFGLTSLLCLLTIPLAIKVLLNFHRYYDKFPQILPANAGTIQLHLTTGLLLGVSFIIGRFI